jgi:hypothetical protein
MFTLISLMSLYSQVPGEGDQRSLYLPLRPNSSSVEDVDSCAMFIDPSNHTLGTTDCKVRIKNGDNGMTSQYFHLEAFLKM